MKPLVLLAVLVALGVGARAEMFRPPVASGRGFHRQAPASLNRQRFAPHVGRTHGPFFAGHRNWRHHDPFLWAGTGLLLGYGLGWFDDSYYAWPRWEPGYPVYRTSPVYLQHPVSVPVAAIPSYAVQASAGVRDARSPDQLRSIFGAQAEALIQGD